MITVKQMTNAVDLVELITTGVKQVYGNPREQMAAVFAAASTLRTSGAHAGLRLEEHIAKCMAGDALAVGMCPACGQDLDDGACPIHGRR